MVKQLGGGELECHGGHGGHAQSGDAFLHSQAVASTLDLA